MKHITFIALISLSLGSIISVLANDAEKEDLKPYEEIHLLPDAIVKAAEGHPYIVQTISSIIPFDYLWSVIISDDRDSSFAYFNGTTQYAGEKKFDHNLRFDTVQFEKHNTSLLQWAFDSLANESRLMVPAAPLIKGATFRISIFDSKGKRLCCIDYADSFSGPDSVIYNKKLRRLEALMYWLATPADRLNVPDSLIYGMTKKKERTQHFHEVP